MVEALAFALSAYAPFGGWPWWSAIVFGVVAGIWTTGVRSFVKARVGGDGGFNVTSASLVVGAAVLGGLLCLVVYFAARSIALQS